MSAPTQSITNTIADEKSPWGATTITPTAALTATAHETSARHASPPRSGWRAAATPHATTAPNSPRSVPWATMFAITTPPTANLETMLDSSLGGLEGADGGGVALSSSSVGPPPASMSWSSPPIWKPGTSNSTTNHGSRRVQPAATRYALTSFLARPTSRSTFSRRLPAEL